MRDINKTQIEILEHELEIHQMLLENSEYSNKVLTVVSCVLSIIVIWLI